MKAALVHDWMNQIGGAEDVLESMAGMFPQAPIYTSLYAPDRMPDHWRDWDIRTSFIDRLPFAQKKQQLYFPLYPLAFEQIDTGGYDLILSNKSGFCHGVITTPETIHICYCLTPTRYVWRFKQYAEKENLSRATRLVLRPFLAYLRKWDLKAAGRVDHFIAISEEVRRRIAKTYGRESTIIYPPVDIGRFEPETTQEDYYLFVGRLVPYRRIDLLVEAFNKMDRPLVIAGRGRDQSRLQALAGPTITFLGYVPDDKLPDLFARCRAFVFPGEEDFGIAPIQAMASGRPVIAYAAGGAVETVVSGAGRLFAEQSVTAMIEAVEGFDPDSVDERFIRAQAEKYDVALFRQRLEEFIERKLEEDSRI
jgi:glycosyltransferase involved in cell wall biosynthesis